MKDIMRYCYECPSISKEAHSLPNLKMAYNPIVYNFAINTAIYFIICTIILHYHDHVYNFAQRQLLIMIMSTKSFFRTCTTFEAGDGPMKKNTCVPPLIPVRYCNQVIRGGESAGRISFILAPMKCLYV